MAQVSARKETMLEEGAFRGLDSGPTQTPVEAQNGHPKPSASPPAGAAAWDHPDPSGPGESAPAAAEVDPCNACLHREAGRRSFAFHPIGQWHVEMTFLVSPICLPCSHCAALRALVCDRSHAHRKPHRGGSPADAIERPAAIAARSAPRLPLRIAGCAARLLNPAPFSESEAGRAGEELTAVQAMPAAPGQAAVAKPGAGSASAEQPAAVCMGLISPRELASAGAVLSSRDAALLPHSGLPVSVQNRELPQSPSLRVALQPRPSRQLQPVGLLPLSLLPPILRPPRLREAHAALQNPSPLPWARWRPRQPFVRSPPPRLRPSPPQPVPAAPACVPPRRLDASTARDILGVTLKNHDTLHHEDLPTNRERPHLPASQLQSVHQFCLSRAVP
jgi:hypothetical protein